MNVVKILLALKALGEGVKWEGTFDGKAVEVPRVQLDLEGGRVRVTVAFRGSREHCLESLYEIRGGSPDVVRYDGRKTEQSDVSFDAGLRGLGARLQYGFRFTNRGVAHELAVKTRLDLDVLL